MPKAKMLLVLCFGLLIATPLLAQLDLSPPINVDVGPPPGQTIVVPLNLTNSGGTVIRTFGLKFTFPTDRLTFLQTSKAGTLTQDWSNPIGQETNPGEITIGGFENVNPAVTTSGVLLNVEFQVKDGAGAGLLQLSNFTDDIAGATTTDGFLNSTVPVELASFSAQVAADGSELVWVTFSESNNFGFEVQRRSAGDEFGKIGFVPGNGTTVSERRYSFTDKSVTVGTHAYRLKQIDLDGSFEFSPTVEVDINGPTSFALAQNFPNPFNPETQIRFSLPDVARVTIRIYDQLGREVRTLVENDYQAGEHLVTWDAKDSSGTQVATGTYFYSFRASDFVSTKKMIFLK